MIQYFHLLFLLKRVRRLRSIGQQNSRIKIAAAYARRAPRTRRSYHVTMFVAFPVQNARSLRLRKDERPPLPASPSIAISKHSGTLRERCMSSTRKFSAKTKSWKAHGAAGIGSMEKSRALSSWVLLNSELSFSFWILFSNASQMLFHHTRRLKLQLLNFA